LYSASSRLSLQLAEGKSQQPFYCSARHPQGSKVVSVSNRGPSPNPTTLLILHPPSQEDFQGPYRNSTILCQALGTSGAQLRWLKNSAEVTEGVTTEGLVGAEGGYPEVTNSRLVVTEAEWNSGAVFSCQLDEEIRNTSKAQECG
ncbi:IGHM protein, partial [Ramphastos sulfuratus]|nr:IGHM protein [Ramphastos sulfuratus]